MKFEHNASKALYVGYVQDNWCNQSIYSHQLWVVSTCQQRLSVVACNYNETRFVHTARKVLYVRYVWEKMKCVYILINWYGMKKNCMYSTF